MKSDKEFEIEKLNLLAFPRNQHPKCVLTGLTATVQLVTPHCTLYYASESHALQAWNGIIRKIAHLIGPLLGEAPVIGTSEERNRRAKNIVLSKRSLIEFCLAEASNLLSSKKFELAIPGAIQALKYSKDIFGDMSVNIVEPYLILAQASLGLQNTKHAEEYLALAKWIVLNSTECSDRVKSRLHQLFGRLHATEGSFDLAKPEFATSIFFSSKCNGAESIATSTGYYSLGDIFLAQGNVENSLAFFDKVVDIWYKYLSALHSRAVENMNGGGEKQVNEYGEVISSPSLEEPTEAQLTDGYNQLSQISDNRKRLLGAHHIATGEVQYCLGLFEFFIHGNEPKSAEYMVMAHKIYDAQLGPSHSSTLHVKAVLSLVQQQPWNPDEDQAGSHTVNESDYL